MVSFAKAGMLTSLAIGRKKDTRTIALSGVGSQAKISPPMRDMEANRGNRTERADAQLELASPGRPPRGCGGKQKRLGDRALASAAGDRQHAAVRKHLAQAHAVVHVRHARTRPASSVRRALARFAGALRAANSLAPRSAVRVVAGAALISGRDAGPASIGHA